MRAFLMLREDPHYRREAFAAGLSAVGFSVECSYPHLPRYGDVLVIWNRYGMGEDAAHLAEAAGIPVIVAENGYIGADPDGRQLYAMSLEHHNGAGRWPIGIEARWDRLGVELAPWRSDGSHIQILPQRGIGPAGVAMPHGWTERTVARLQKASRRDIRVRAHPAGLPAPTTLEEDLAGAWCAVVWGSSAGLKAMALGIPVFHDLHNWIGAAAARFGIDNIESPLLGDRLPMFRRLAHAQWTTEEIASGEPFRRLLSIAA